MRNLYDSGVFPRAKGGIDTEILTGVFRNRKTAKGVPEGGAISISRAVIRGGMSLPPQVIRVVITDTYDFDAEVPRALSELGMEVGGGRKTVLKRYRKSSIEFPVRRADPAANGALTTTPDENTPGQ